MPRCTATGCVQEFPALQFVLFHKAAEVTGDLSDIDVMMMFGIEVRDPMLSGAPQLRWIQSFATGVDHFLRCPSLKPDVLITSGRGIHGPPMREQVIYMMMARQPRRGAADRRPEERISGSGGCGARCTARPRSIAGTGVVGSAIGEAAQGARHARRRRLAHAAPSGRLRRDDPTDRLVEAAARADYLINMLPATHRERRACSTRKSSAR